MRSSSERLLWATTRKSSCHFVAFGFSGKVSVELFLLVVTVVGFSCQVCSAVSTHSTSLHVNSASSLRTLPTLKIIEYDDTGSFIQNTLSIYPNSDLVFGDEEHSEKRRVKKIVLECSASYPVQFSYTGDGSRNYVENSLVDENRVVDESTGKTTTRFLASLSFPRNLGEEDTGKYTCTNMIKTEVRSSVFLFVPGSGRILFTSSAHANSSVASFGKGKIYYSSNESTVRIPCSVTQPNVLVSLHKFQGSLTRCPLDETLTYNPKSGFQLHPKKLIARSVDPSGFYICSAALNGVFQFIEYTLIPLEGVGASTTVISQGLTNAAYSPEEEKIRSCSSQNDCSSGSACIARQCLSPCAIMPAASCPQFSTCQTRNHKPSCLSASKLDSESQEDQIADDVDIFHVDAHHRPQGAILRSACNPTVCGRNSECVVIEYKPYCVCFEGYTGNGRVSCHRIQEEPRPTTDDDVCSNARCGLHSACQEINGHAVCSCLADTNGYPPHCKPESECSTDSDCPDELFCNSRFHKCQEPCETFGSTQTCARNARCKAKKHRAHCACNPGFTGNPQSRCVPVRSAGQLPVVRTACHPSPCGVDARCRTIQNEVPYCYCPQGLKGNPRIRCSPPPPTKEKIQATTITPWSPQREEVTTTTEITPESAPCQLNPCSENAACRVINGITACKCPLGFAGDPYIWGCYPASDPKPERQRPVGVTKKPAKCRRNEDCDDLEACYNSKCVNPCVGSCGTGARCKIVNHTPLCSCPGDWVGDPLVNCRKRGDVVSGGSNYEDPCTSCGPNSNCKILNRRVHCECNRWSIGSPPKCSRADCNSDEGCPDNKKCLQNVCVNPCTHALGRPKNNNTNVCAPNAQCEASNHSANCYCPRGFDGDARVSCREKSTIYSSNPCVRAPCGQNSHCTIVVGLVNYRRCICDEGFYLTHYGCRKIQHQFVEGNDSPCLYSPCGPNSLCSSLGGVAYCRCDDKSGGTYPYCTPNFNNYGGQWTFHTIQKY